MTDDKREDLKQQIAEIFEIGPDEMWLLEPTSEEVQLKAEREYAATVMQEQWAAAVRLSAALPPGMTWVVE